MHRNHMQSVGSHHFAVVELTQPLVLTCINIYFCGSIGIIECKNWSTGKYIVVLASQGGELSYSGAVIVE